jgi:hypothetical protein
LNVIRLIGIKWNINKRSIFVFRKKFSWLFLAFALLALPDCNSGGGAAVAPTLDTTAMYNMVAATIQAMETQTAQAVPPDEHPWVETFGATRAYREFRARVREYYRRNYPLTAEARAQAYLNPGNGNVSRLCHEPRVALAVLNGMLAPYLSGARLTILCGHKPVAADVERDSVAAVTVRNLRTGGEVVLRAPYLVDATEL